MQFAGEGKGKGMCQGFKRRKPKELELPEGTVTVRYREVSYGYGKLRERVSGGLASKSTSKVHVTEGTCKVR